ncbi:MULTISPECIES: peptide-methionine (R)-S-oxide reductase MsrB [Gammaproteobacteria]|uniref:peptide-methionine (R)-S-oxide reductase MsrB n=1 Tax=Gammaproteobacteria TaxID=1236 RepID=UPI000DCF8AE5|nr:MULTISPECIES: peptide-methionine (R)-S-oxide reductase MsrB [Gammaproteobacteria]RTE87202.1 peptide-methionine (R)-S-oxide reductase [Aliidiomarina sp. B3213]TCZ93010.1 peptide-methionine (R)-S-oxide reductase [Lysobacter sp. N42]
MTNHNKTNEEWRKILQPEQFKVLREKGTERPFTGELLNESRKGAYHCAGCDSHLFDSDTKFDAGCGWPSFYAEAAGNNIEYVEDYSHGMTRTEIVCKHCGGHLGHVFPDGPEPTGQRYCVNSLSLTFKPK